MENSEPNDPTTTVQRKATMNQEWGKDITKAKLTQSLRGEDDMADNKKIISLVTHIITAILSGLAGFFGSN